ncbi:hypothetical protein IFM89_027562 [Coptis chinensis]|uniref:Disease resistance protein n=1 Tax=Coptis chinensis TaxID=261450 RepID=A0A835HQM4_9MAGN|nr:hypothetical protein IFM89_027562 [Coptis chinensis]
MEECGWAHLYFPKLKKLSVIRCPNLHKLPISFDGVAESHAKIEIKGELEWWNNLSWGKDEKFVTKHVNFTHIVLNR